MEFEIHVASESCILSGQLVVNANTISSTEDMENLTRCIHDWYVVKARDDDV